MDSRVWVRPARSAMGSVTVTPTACDTSRSEVSLRRCTLSPSPEGRRGSAAADGARSSPVGELRPRVHIVVVAPVREDRARLDEVCDGGGVAGVVRQRVLVGAFAVAG